MQVLLEKTKYDPDWWNTSDSYDPITLIKWIERKILAQAKYQYCYATVYDKYCALHGLEQQNLTNKYYYESFNTNINGVQYIGITRQHHVIM